MHGEIKKLLLSKLLCTCPFPFEQKYPESNNRASTENLLPFFINEGSHFEEIFCVKEPTPELLTIQFSAAMKTLVIYSSLLNFPSYLHRQFARGGGEWKKEDDCHTVEPALPLFVAQQNCHKVSYEKPLLMSSPVTRNMANGHILKSQTVESSILLPLLQNLENWEN